ncbi:MAG: vWA domain-containing protein [Pseudomonadota bacterium]
MRTLTIWAVLVCVSIIIHAIISGRVGGDIDKTLMPHKLVEVRVEFAQPPEEPEPERQPPEDVLEFVEEFELEPPKMLVAPQAVEPPPPDVPVSLRADSGGNMGFDIPSMVASEPIGEGFGTAGFGPGIGNALGNSTNRFAAFLADLRNNGLDIVFVLDATSSMGWALDQIKERINDIVRTVRTLVPTARFGFVAYRDQGDPEFVVRVRPLTFSTANLSDFLDSFKADGGGDVPEDIGAGIDAAVDQSGWRPGARRIMIIVGDAPPREEDLPSVLRSVRSFTETGGTISTLDVSPDANPKLIELREGHPVNPRFYRGVPMREFLMISEAGRGDSGTLSGDVNITKRLLTLIMGEEFANEMRALFEVI